MTFHALERTQDLLEAGFIELGGFMSANGDGNKVTLNFRHEVEKIIMIGEVPKTRFCV